MSESMRTEFDVEMKEFLSIAKKRSVFLNIQLLKGQNFLPNVSQNMYTGVKDYLNTLKIILINILNQQSQKIYYE